MKTAHMSVFSSPAVVAACALVLLALVVAGCGGGGGGGSAGVTPPALNITTSSLPDGTVGRSYSQTLQASGGTGTRMWSLASSSGPLPDGLSLSSAGVISGTPTAAGAFSFTVQVQDSASPPQTDTQNLSITIVALEITTTALPGATTGQAYDQTIMTSGGTTPFTWTEPTDSFEDNGVGVSATPCEGLLLGLSATGTSTTVSGTPINTGICGPFTLRVDDSGTPAQFDEQSFSITVTAGPLSITTESLPAASVNRTYLVDIDASGGTPPLTWSEPGGALDAPATPCQGLTLTADTGEISGTPVNEGTCGGPTGFTINVQDSLAVSDSKPFTIEVGPEPASGRNDTVATATDYTAAGLGPTLGDKVITASISPYDPTDLSIPNAADNDFYKFTAQVDMEVEVEVVARGLSTFSGMDPVLEIVTDDGSQLGQRINGACQESGDDPNSTTGNTDGVLGNPDPTPTAFDDNCINDDIVLGQVRDSRLIYKVQSGKTTFYVRVLDWRGDARPDFIYELHIQNAD